MINLITIITFEFLFYNVKIFFEFIVFNRNNRRKVILSFLFL